MTIQLTKKKIIGLIAIVLIYHVLICAFFFAYKAFEKYDQTGMTEAKCELIQESLDNDAAFESEYGELHRVSLNRDYDFAYVGHSTFLIPCDVETEGGSYFMWIKIQQVEIEEYDIDIMSAEVA